MAAYKTTGTSALKKEHPFVVIDGLKRENGREETSLRSFLSFNDARQFEHKDNITLSDNASKQVGLGIFLTALLTIGFMALLTVL